MSDAKKSTVGIHYQVRGDEVHFHVSSKGELQTMPKNAFFSCFPKEPYHGIKEAKWAEYLTKNDKVCAEFTKKYGGKKK